MGIEISFRAKVTIVKLSLSSTLSVEETESEIIVVSEVVSVSFLEVVPVPVAS